MNPKPPETPRRPKPRPVLAAVVLCLVTAADLSAGPQYGPGWPQWRGPRQDAAAGYKEVGRVHAIDGRCWTMPALADGRLYVRSNKGDLVCLQVRETDGGVRPAKPPSGSGRSTYPQPPVSNPQSPIPNPSPPSPHWPRFRGADGSGVASCKTAPTAWNGRTGQGILWKTPAGLPGYSSPIVWQDRVFLTGADRQMRELCCFDARSGNVHWRKALQDVPGSQPGLQRPWGSGSHAASTPVTNGTHVWAIFANGDLACFDYEGRQIWARNLGLPKNGYGHAASLALDGKLVLVQLDQEEPEKGRSKLLGIDGTTGRTVWEAARPVSAGWGTPIVIATQAGRQIVACGNPWVIAYEPSAGKELWRADVLDGGYYAVPSPIYSRGLVFSVTDGAVLAAIRPDGTGDVRKTHVLWTAEDDLPNVCSPVSDGRSIFLLSSAGVLGCFDIQTGKRTWSKDFSDQGRTDFQSVLQSSTDSNSVLQVPRSFEASPTLAAGRLYLLDNAGRMVMVPATATEPKDSDILMAELGEPCQGASPAVVEGRLFIRGEKHLYCIGPRGADPR